MAASSDKGIYVLTIVNNKNVKPPMGPNNYWLLCDISDIMKTIADNWSNIRGHAMYITLYYLNSQERTELTYEIFSRKKIGISKISNRKKPPFNKLDLTKFEEFRGVAKVIYKCDGPFCGVYFSKNKTKCKYCGYTCIRLIDDNTILNSLTLSDYTSSESESDNDEVENDKES